MKHILSARQHPVLERLAASRALLAFDYDGVLAPVVTDPAGAPMRPGTRRLLRQLAGAWPCAVVSGRAWAHTRWLTAGVVPHVVGNHGFELGHARPVPARVLARVRRWRAALERELGDVRGVHFEDKRSTLAIHYGLHPRWRAAERAVLRAAGRLDGVRLVRGKKLLNVLPAGFPDKGDAIRALLRRLRLETALYVGDDVTDEDAFALGEPAVVGVRVGRGRSLAPWRLRDQGEIDDLLAVLAELRASPRRRELRTPGSRGRPRAGTPRAAAARSRPSR